jgi:hypothetical protein
VWEVEVIDEFREWYEALDEDAQIRIYAVVEALSQQGPKLGRPLVGEIAGSRIHNLKELRPPSSSIRILFVFDPRRSAILLLGADKAEHGWSDWYPRAISRAERLYDEYLEELRKEGLIR